MYKGNILDVEGIKVGQVEDKEALTGCTVVICEKGAVCGVDIRGSAPGTRETDLLNPINLVDKVHAVVLSGGSAFGLDASSGVMKYLEENNIGFDVGVTKVPIVASAVLFDLHVGNYKIRPDFDMGYKACKQASDQILNQGNYGAGCGATCGKINGTEYATKTGIGSYSIKLENGLVVAALVAANPFGDIYEDGKIIAGALDFDKKNFINTYEQMKKKEKLNGFSINNTTIGIVATNAKINKAEATKVSQMAHNGYAKAILPIHTMYDGDTIFTIATGKIECDISLLGTMAAEAVQKSIINAVKNSESVKGIPSYKDIFKNV
ncbi:L-aminopeptidase/D-esterase [Alkalithermobacter thermoalcaliphilus JW-YL-7 = DSM 7308]|uniref:L-aminopeptidase/D-esterase n=1 Tax=Alkalithermobacter thermoalcaliphilus JW-YL-7 = DSM 7308 TaxID=1121328 RepID=A0A150FMP4_CLOPD|nr:peptidase S58 DmpA [[Clostridium] paradoxum JW-YL-7 = DSM 7308]SHL31323.1 L-aminopeptidase/D-esterase [[Clostridium] paradoxum JW-YL-7 = DSM 7308]